MNQDDAIAVIAVAYAAIKITALTYSHLKSKATAERTAAAKKESK